MKRLRFLVLVLCLLTASLCLYGCKDVKVESIQFNQHKVTLAVGAGGYDVQANVVADNSKLVATVLPYNAKNRSVEFKVDNTAVVELVNNKLIAKSVGFAHLTATTKDGNFSDSVTIEVVNATSKLSTVTGIRFENNKVVWNAVANADYYTVMLNNGDEGEVVLPEFTNFEAGISNTIQVKAHSIGNAYLESDLSSNFTFTQLNSPLNITNQNYQIKWDSVVGAIGYNVFVDNEKVNAEELAVTNIMLNKNLFSDGKSHDVSIIAIGDNVNAYTSMPSQALSLTVLQSPTSIQLTQGMVVFNEIPYATCYNVKIDNTEYQATSTVFEIPQAVTSGEHTLKIQAVGNNTGLISSEYSAVALTFTKLPEISDIYVQENVIKWDKVANAGGYLIEITQEESKKIIDLGTASLFHLSDEYLAGEYSIRVACVGTGNQYVRSNFSNTKTFTKLATPEEFSIVNGKIKFNAVENASNYIINVNGEEKTVSADLALNNVFEIDLSLNSGNYNLKVKAVGDNNTYLNSAYSQVVNTTKLDKVSKIYLENGIIKWIPVKNSFGYNVKINNEVVEYNSLETINNKVVLDLSDSAYNETFYNIQVQALSSESDINSDYSSVYSFKKYETPSDIKAYLGKLRFTYNQNASIYNIKINSEIKEMAVDMLEMDNSVSPKYYLCDLLLENYISGNLNISINIQGNDEYISSSYSNETEFTMSKNLTNLQIKDNILSFKKLEEGSVLIGYEGESSVGNALKKEEQATTEASYNLPNFLNEELPSGNYTFKLRAQGNSEYILNGAFQTVSTSILSAPNSLRVENGFIQWNNVRNSTGYKLKVLLGTETVKEISLGNVTYCDLSTDNSINVNTDYKVTVQAIGDGKNSVTSAFIEESNHLEVNLLSAPTNLRVEEGEVIWANVENAELYGMYVDGTKLSTVTKEAEKLQNGIPAGTHKIKVYAYGDSVKYLTSTTSNELEIVKLETPTNLKIKDAVLSCEFPAYSKGIKLFTAIDNEEYDENGTFFLASENPDGVIVDLSNNNSGYYSYKVQSIGDSTKYVSSNESLTCATTVMEKPEQVFVNKGTVNWSDVTGVSTYNLYIDYYGEDGSSLQNSVTKEGIDATQYLLNTDFLKGIYKISVQAIGDQSKFITSKKSYELEVEKLGIPKNLSTEKGEIVFNALNGAGAYNIYVDGEKCEEITNPNNSSILSYELPESIPAGDHKIMVQAVGDDIKYLTGEAGATVVTSGTSVEVINAYIDVTKLEIAKDYILRNGTLEWVANESASGYKLQVNNIDFDDVINPIEPASEGEEGSNSTEIEVNRTYYELDDSKITAGKKSVKLKTIGGNSSSGKRFLNSNYTAAINATKLETVKNIQVNYENDVEKCGTIVWDRIENNNGYIITIAGRTEKIITEKDQENCELISEDIASGELSLTIKARGTSSSSEGEKYISGSNSESQTYIKLSTPQDFKIKDGKLTWSYDNGYKFVVSITSNGKETCVEVDKQEAIIDTSFTSGTYDIKVKAQGKAFENGTNTINSSYTQVINAIKPDMPTNVTVNKFGVVEWDTIAAASNYIVSAYYKNLDDLSNFTENDRVKTYNEIENVCYLGESGRYYFGIVAVSEQGLYSEQTQYIETILDGFKEGDGTSSNPYQVSSVEDFIRVKEYPSSYFLQTADIDLTGATITPMFIEEEFKGNYNGANYKISNLVLNSSINSTSLGIFSNIASTGVVKNLKLENVTLTLGSKQVGGIAGINYGTIENCSVTGSVTSITISTNNTTELNIGGIAGYNAQNAIIKGCFTEVTIKGLIENTQLTTRCAVTSGGISGSNNGTITQCYTGVKGIIYGNTSGGISGINLSKIEQCYNQSHIYGSNITFSSVERSGYAGGIVGMNSNSTSTIIFNCYNLGKVECFDNSAVSTTNYSLYASGIAGNNKSGSTNEARIVNCYNLATIELLTTKGKNYFNTTICYNDARGYVDYSYSISGTTAVYGGDRNVGENVIQYQSSGSILSEAFAETLNNNISEITSNSDYASYNLSTETVWVYANGLLSFTWQQ